MSAAPYPKDTRAKGWRFEIDMERVRQSDTWALCPREVRPWLLLMWATAWEQLPCGSMPANDALIAARLDMPAELFATHREVLLRGWDLADDGRLYHPTITERVLDMLGAKDRERQRKANYRAKKEAQRQDPEMSHGTNTGHDGDSQGSDPGGDATRTSTRTSTSTSTGFSNTDIGLNPTLNAGAGESQAGPVGHPTPAAEICLALRRAGLGTVNPSSPRLTALIAAGATVDEFLAHVPKALQAGENPFAYLMGAVEGERKRAASGSAQLHRGPLPTAPVSRQQAIEDQNKRVGRAWAMRGTTT